MQLKQDKDYFFSYANSRSQDVGSLDLVSKTHDPLRVVPITKLTLWRHYGCCSCSHYIHAPNTGKEGRPKDKRTCFL